jgi:hypothetical protein
MTRDLVLHVALFSLLTFSAVESAGPDERLAEARNRHVGPRECATHSPCAACTDRIAILESGRPPLPGEDGTGVQSCTLINTSAEWDAYCANNAVPDCPLLDDAFFAQHTVVAVAVDTLTSRACEGSPDPAWKLDCVTSSAAVRVVKERPGGWCHCSAMPQHLQRLFLASAVPKTRAKRCRACEEPHTINCLR